MDGYINNQLAVAKELLESGIQMQKGDLIFKAKSVYTNMKNMTKDNEEFYKNVKENMIRACSALCVYDPKNAMTYLDEAIKFDPNHPVILNNYGYIYHTQFANWDKSIQYYEKCLISDPTYVTAYLGIIDVYRTLRHHKLELEYCRKAVAHCDKSPELWNSMGLALLHNHLYKNMDEIFSCLEKALTFEPNNETRSKIYVNTGHLHGILGDFSLAVNYYLEAINADKTHQPAYQNILLNLHYFSDLDFHDTNFLGVMKRFGVQREKRESMSAVIKKLHISITKELYGDKFPQPEKLVTGSVSRKIVIGYLTSDLIDHAVSFFAKTLFSHYNKSAYDVYIYSNNIYDAGSISEIPCTGYRCVKGATAADSAIQIKKDAVDILIDLSGHTSGNRLDICALRPAPIILSYLGYPDDTGFPFMRRISDVYSERGNKSTPENGNKSEETSPVRLQRLFMTYTPSSIDYNQFVKSFEKYDVKKGVKFGCFAKLQKINKHVIAVWKEILKRVPNSKLLLKSRYFADEKILEIWKAKFGEMSKRVVFLIGTTSAEKHMEMYNLIDIHLDTFPYSGTTITTESLYMNVPVVTLAVDKVGIAHVSRVSGSIINSMGLEKELVAGDVREYVEKSISLSRKLRTFPSVRERFLCTQITQRKEFMDEFEKTMSDLFLEESWKS